MKEQTRRVLLERAAATVLLASPARTALARGRVKREVLAFYYAWYGDPSNHPDWRGIDIQKRVIGNAAHYPEAGPYDSRDPAIIQRQMTQMKEAGITGLIYSWWGIGTYEDRHLDAVIQAAATEGLSVSLYYETAAPAGRHADAGAIGKDFDYISDRYLGADNWLRVDGKPVLFLYGRALDALPRATWRGIVSDAKRRHPPGLLFSVAAQSNRDLDFMDGIHRYALVADVQHRDPEAAATWARSFFPKYLKEQSRYPVTTLTVYPGYDDTHLGRARAIDTGRFNGRMYATLWEQAIKAGPDWVLVTSWNEWHEGTEIEPSVQFHGVYLDLTAKFAKQFLAG